MRTLFLFLVIITIFPMTVAANDFLQNNKAAITDRNDFGIFIYENPANEVAKFEVLTPEAVDVSVLIYDNQGNVLFSQKGNTQVTGNINSFKINWDLTAKTGKRIAAGIYIIQATAKNTTGSGIYQYFAQLGVKK